MKIALLALFFLLLTFTNAEFVYDNEGERLSKAHTYHIAIGSEIGRSYFTLPNVGKQSCPLPVEVAPITPEYFPLPVKFSNDIIYPFATTDMPLNFTFVYIPLCSETSKWFVEKLIPSGFSLMFGDAESALSLKGEFFIKKYGEFYKIIFCPEESPETCGDLHIGNGSYLNVKFGGVVPFPVSFEKVGSDISMVV